MSQVTSSATTYPLVDGLGSIRALTDSTGLSIGSQTYDAYGSVRSTTGTTLPFGFSGEQTDPESGLIYLRARYLDRTTGRFLTKDPANSGWAYGYANDNPVVGTDPTGQAMVACDTPDDCGSAPVVTDADSWESASSMDDSASQTPTVPASPSVSTCGDSPVALGPCAAAAGQAISTAAKDVLQGGLDIAAVPPYGEYYTAHAVLQHLNQLGARNGTIGGTAAYVIGAPLVLAEAAGLGGDIAIDWVKGHTVNQETICDEGVVGYLNPLHSFVPRSWAGPQVYLPGVHANGTVDWEW